MNTLDMIMKLGVDWTRQLAYKQSDNTTPVNLTGYTARMQVRATVASSTKILDLTTENGSIVIDGPNGTITLTLTHTQLTEGLTGLNLKSITSDDATVYETIGTGNVKGTGKIAVYDLDIIAPSGSITKLLTGKICFDPSVTR